MTRLLRLFPVFLLLATAALAQVSDDFSDGDFTHDPPWTGDTERFTVVPFGADYALRSDGLARPDTIALATASDVTHGRWTFTFHHEANLSTANGTRVYLIADTPELKGDVHGYYVQLGTNNTDQVRLYRQDGAPTQRTLLGNSTSTPVAGDTSTVFVEVFRDEAGHWEVRVDGETLIEDVTDATYTSSAALGVWLKHSTLTGDRFYWDDFLADPAEVVDLTPPEPIGAIAQDEGAALLVTFDEPLDPASVTPGAFSVSEGVGEPISAEMFAPETVRLAFEPPLAPGAYVLTVAGVADLAGNVQEGATLAFSVEEADTEPPVLVAAEALSATEVALTFDEPVVGCDAAAYEIDHGVGQPAEIECPPGPSPERTLLLAQPLAPGLTYTVTARGIEDVAGNVQPETSASFYFGAFETPEPLDVVINEIMYDPPDLASNEWVELFNRSGRAFDLSEFIFADDQDRPVRVSETPHALGPEQYAVLVRNAEAFEAAFPGVPYIDVTGFPALNNPGDDVILRHVSATGDTTTVDSLRYAQSWGGRKASLERRSPEGPSTSPSNWATTTDPSGGTPGRPNTAEPDTEPPVPLTATISDDGLSIAVLFDKPLDPATVTAGAFSISGGVGTPAGALYDESDGPRAILVLAAPPPEPGTYVLTVAGVADLLGNVQTGATVEFAYEPDLTPPALVSAVALDAATLEVTFSEPVTEASASEPANYEIDHGIGHPEAVEHAPEGRAERVRLTLAVPLEGPRAYTLTARGIADLAGNVLEEGQIAFYFGEGEVPEPGDLVVNEIMYDPPEIANNEWVELFNRSGRAFDLSEFTLADEASVVRVTAEPRFVLPGEYAVLVRNAEAFEAAFPGVPFIDVERFPNLNNSGDAVVIRHAPSAGGAEVLVDSVRYVPGWGGRKASLERRSPEGPSNSAGNWATTLAPEGGTPGAPNSLPPDTEPPVAEEVLVENDGLVLHVVFDEALEAASVTPAAFSIDGAAPESADYDEEPDPVVRLTLGEALEAGTHTLLVQGVRDLVGNEQQGQSIEFVFSPDVTPPALVGASAPSPTLVVVTFSEPLDPSTASEPENYEIDREIGHPEAVAFAPEGRAERVALTLAHELEEGALYTLTVRGVADRFGNVLEEGQIRFILGEGDTPQPGDLVINEIMYDLPSARNDEEYVELFNRSERTFDLSRFTLSDAGQARPISPAPRLLLPGEYVAVVAGAEAFVARFGEGLPFLEMPRFPNLNNSGDVVAVRFEGEVIDSLTYDPSWQRPELRSATGIALERIDPEGASTSAQNWTSSLEPSGGTPGRRNSVFLEPGEEPEAPGLVADPSPFQADIGTRLRYTLQSEAALVRVRIFDGAGRLVRTLEEAALSGSTVSGTIPWNGLDDENRPLRVGIYVVFLEALDLAGGRTEAYRTAVVLGRQL